MAIDTAAKRRGVASIGVAYFAPGVTPDATPDIFWRQTSGWGYGGIGADAPLSSGAGSRYYYTYRYGGMTALLLALGQGH